VLIESWVGHGFERLFEVLSRSRLEHVSVWGTILCEHVKDSDVTCCWGGWGGLWGVTNVT
jgi:hypothetical protein